MSIYLAKDGTSVAATNSPLEVDAVHFPGLYKIVLTTSEMECDSISVGGTSSTPDVIIIPVLLMTESGTITEIEADISAIEGVVGLTDDFVDWSYTVTNSTDGSPIPLVRVAVSTDNHRENVVALGFTDNFGIVTFRLAHGTYYVWRSHSGFMFDDPDVEVV